MAGDSSSAHSEFCVFTIYTFILRYFFFLPFLFPEVEYSIGVYWSCGSRRQSIQLYNIFSREIKGIYA